MNCKLRLFPSSKNVIRKLFIVIFVASFCGACSGTYVQRQSNYQNTSIVNGQLVSKTPHASSETHTVTTVPNTSTNTPTLAKFHTSTQIATLETTPSPTQTEIDFRPLVILVANKSYTNEDGRDIYYIPDLNSEPQQITRMGGVHSFSWSPDGKQMVFSTYEVPTFNLYIVNIDGTGLHPLELPIPDDKIRGKLWEPNWSPNGSQIAFSDHVGWTSYIYLTNPDGTEQTYLTEGSVPKWSPDGRKIAFIKREQNLIAGSLFVIDLETKDLQQPKVEDLYFVTGVWSPDGKKILFYGYDDQGHHRDGIYLWDLETGNIEFIVKGIDPFCWRSIERGFIYRSEPDYLTYYDLQTGQKTNIPGLPEARYIDAVDEQP